ncbi:MAG: nucleotidyltransferase family protein [Lentisphaerae bacterium]|nr:nucleotidyltransferase family protein [Lentisphaerota bacterium]
MEFKQETFLKNSEILLMIELLKWQQGNVINKRSKLYTSIGENSIDFNRFISLVESHRVQNHIYLAANELNIFPKDILCKFEAVKSASDKFALKQAYELKKISDLCHKNNIKFTVLKGLPLSKSLYGDISIRASRDIDILVQDKDLYKVIKAFEKSYLALTPINNKLEDIKRYCPHIEYKSRATGILVEVHWKLFNYDFQGPSFFDFAKKNLIYEELLGARFYTYNFKCNFLYCLIHGSKHRWSRLLWLCDIAAFSNKSEFDIDEIIALAQTFKVTRLVLNSFYLSRVILGIPQKLEIKKMTASNIKYVRTALRLINSNTISVRKDGFIERSKDKITQLKSDFSLQKGFKYKSNVLVKNFITVYDIDIIKLPKRIIFLYIFLHPILAFVRWHKSKK